jgi:hypothetical protein
VIPMRNRPTSRPVPVAIGCTIRVTSKGAVTAHRDHGCTPEDVRVLCDALVRGELEVIDLTPASRSGVEPAPHAL